MYKTYGEGGRAKCFSYMELSISSRNVLVFNMATLEKSQLFLLLNHAVQFLSPWFWYRALSRGLVDSVFLFTLKLVHLVLVIERGGKIQNLLVFEAKFWFLHAKGGTFLSDMIFHMNNLNYFSFLFIFCFCIDALQIRKKSAKKELQNKICDGTSNKSTLSNFS